MWAHRDMKIQIPQCLGLTRLIVCVTRGARVAGRVTHYYHTWLTLHKTKKSHCEGVTSSTVRYLH